MWVEDNPTLVLSELALRETGEEWIDRKAAAWNRNFQKLPISELKKVGSAVKALLLMGTLA